VEVFAEVCFPAMETIKPTSPPTTRALRSRCDRAGVRPPSAHAAISPPPDTINFPERRFEFIPFWGFLVFLLYAMRRVRP
jgi:hypothetical protein